MPVALSDISNMTLLQLASLSGSELDRLGREAHKRLGQADTCVKRLQNARYLRNLAQMRELVGEDLPSNQEGEL